MIPDNHGIWLCRFGEKRWIQKMLDGQISFSCVGAFIRYACSTGNEIQGDLYEGVFARIRKDDSRIQEMKIKLDKDLEILDDGDYVYLRRKSSKYIPVFCFYAITPEVLKEDAINQGINHLGRNRIRHDFDVRMLNGFSDALKVKNVVTDEFRFCSVSMRADSFINRIKIACIQNSLDYQMNSVNYEVEKEEFFIEPTDKYDELFYKRPMYQYQHEARIILHRKSFMNLGDRYNLSVIPFNKNEEYGMAYDSIYIVFTVDLSAV